MHKPISNRTNLFLPSIMAALLLSANACDTVGRERSQSTAGLNTGLDHLSEFPAEPLVLRDINTRAIRAENPSDLLALLDQAQRNSQMDLDGIESPSEQWLQPAPQEVGPMLEVTGPSQPLEVNRGPRVSLDDLVPEYDDLDFVSASPEIILEAAAAPDPEPTPQEQFDRSITEIQMALDDKVRASSEPASEVFRRIALGLVHHSSLVDAAAFGGDVALTPRETNETEAWATFVANVSRLLDSAAGIDSITEPAIKFARALDSWQPLSITLATLCTSVDGFGIYTQQQQYGDAYKFLAGRPIKFLVYVELDHFTHTSKSQDGVWGHEVSLSQDLRLYHMALGGDALVWRLPDEPVLDFSRNQRRDFFVVQLVELPATLGVGGYRLKIALKDNASGAIVEEIIPIEIVGGIAAFQED